MSKVFPVRYFTRTKNFQNHRLYSYYHILAYDPKGRYRLLERSAVRSCCPYRRGSRIEGLSGGLVEVVDSFAVHVFDSTHFRPIIIVINHSPFPLAVLKVCFRTFLPVHMPMSQKPIPVLQASHGTLFAIGFPNFG